MFGRAEDSFFGNSWVASALWIASSIHRFHKWHCKAEKISSIATSNMTCHHWEKGPFTMCVWYKESFVSTQCVTTLLAGSTTIWSALWMSADAMQFMTKSLRHPTQKLLETILEENQAGSKGYGYKLAWFLPSSAMMALLKSWSGVSPLLSALRLETFRNFRSHRRFL